MRKKKPLVQPITKFMLAILVGLLPPTDNGLLISFQLSSEREEEYACH